MNPSQIFISYRDEDRPSAWRVMGQVGRRFGHNKFRSTNVVIAPGEDRLEANKKMVSECDVLLAVIGKHWLTSMNKHGVRRLDDQKDLVRMEIGTVLKRGIPVIPVLVDGASMPEPTDLPEDLKLLTHRNAFPISDTRFFDVDGQRLVDVIERVLDKTALERREHEVSGTDVFIAFKNLDEKGAPTRDLEIARNVCEFLTVKGLKVFFSAVTLEDLGTSAYKKAIDKALDSATVLVAIGTSRSHLDSEWVRYEWDSFYNDILSCIKPNGRVFTYIEGMATSDLPRTLRQTQTLLHSEAGLTSLYNFINAALPRSPEKREREDKKPLEQERQSLLERATKEHPWVNSLEMKFVPVAGTQVLFSVWDTRVQDFETFVADTNYDATGGMWSLGEEGWKLLRGATWREPGFSQGPIHPVVGVSWNDAKKFCEWLTMREQGSGVLPRGWVYRLPTDVEWSAGVGSQSEEGNNPKEKDRRIELYPWGKECQCKLFRLHVSKQICYHMPHLALFEHPSALATGPRAFLFSRR